MNLVDDIVELMALLAESDVEAYGTAYPNGTVQLTMKGDPLKVQKVLHLWENALDEHLTAAEVTL